MKRRIGPGMLVAAAFIGPGTVTTCLRAGVDFGYSLLWALLLSTGATLVLQEMAGRIGLATGQGLPRILRSAIPARWLKYVVLALVLSAVLIGNAAYEAGNIAGGVLGLEALFGSAPRILYPLLIGGLAFFLLWAGSYKLLEGVFTALVALMSISFLLTAILVGPAITEVVSGLFRPNLNSENLFTVMALIGTTVVPYNLFLYPALVGERWGAPSGMNAMRKDIYFSVGVGGLVSMSILVSAAGSGLEGVQGVLDLAVSLEPVYGAFAKFATGLGLLAAGLTSAITAPLAAAYVAQQTFGWGADKKDWRFRLTWGGVLLFGVLSLSLELRPLEVIFFAQVANALMLPLIAVMLWWMAGSSKLLGSWRSGRANRVLGILVCLLVIALGIRSLLAIFDL